MAERLKVKPTKVGVATSGRKGPTLAELQAQLQKAVMGGDDAAVFAEILDNSRTDRGVLFGVYRHAYAARLIEILRNDHALLNDYLGGDAFEEVARGFIAMHPSKSQNARWFSAAFPDYLRTVSTLPLAAAELASIEQMINHTFDAADAPAFTFGELASIPLDQWEALVFAPHPSVRADIFSTNAYEIWKALKEGDAPPMATKRDESEMVIGWRRGETPVVRRTGGEEAMMWQEAAKGIPFGVLCELATVFAGSDDAPLRAATYLKGWIEGGLITAVAFVA